MNRVSTVFFLTLVSAFCIATISLYGCGRSDGLIEIEKKIEKAQTPEKREAISRIRDVFKELRRSYPALKIADYILTADRNIQVMENLAEIAIRQSSGIDLYIFLAEKAAKAPLADKEFLQLAEIFKKRDSGYNFKEIHKLGEEAAQAKTEADLKIVRGKIALLESMGPGSPMAIKEIKYDEQKVNPYVAWLKSNAKPPVDYILDLFRTYDIVIIAERMHPETTQWDFLYELTSDPRFIENVGNIFTEYGSVIQQPELERFMNTPLTPEDRDKAVIHLLQNFEIWPSGWTNNNFYTYLGKIHLLNQQLDPQKRISLFFSDIPWQWEGMTKKEYDRKLDAARKHRDEIMAERITKKFREIQASESPRKKALVVMNTRHAFGALYNKGKMFQNTGGFLMNHFPGKVANVMMNSPSMIYYEKNSSKMELIRKVMRAVENNLQMNPKKRDDILISSQEFTCMLTQNGKWDAAFWLTGNKPMGFNFKGSPFGIDMFDYFAPGYSMFKYENVFTGMVFYQPLDQHMIESNIPGYFDGDFQRIVLERSKLLGDKYVNEVRHIIEIDKKMGNSSNKRRAYNVKLVFTPKRQ